MSFLKGLDRWIARTFFRSRRKKASYNPFTGGGFSTVGDYVNFKTKYLPYLVILLVSGSIWITLVQIQKQQEIRSSAEITETATPSATLTPYTPSD